MKVVLNQQTEETMGVDFKCRFEREREKADSSSF